MLGLHQAQGFLTQSHGYPRNYLGLKAPSADQPKCPSWVLVPLSSRLVDQVFFFLTRMAPTGFAVLMEERLSRLHVVSGKFTSRQPKKSPFKNSLQEQSSRQKNLAVNQKYLPFFGFHMSSYVSTIFTRAKKQHFFLRSLYPFH